MDITNRISGIYKPRIKRPEIFIQEGVFPTASNYTRYLQSFFPGLETHYLYHNGLDKDVVVFMADGSQFVILPAARIDNMAVIEHSFCISKKTNINTYLSDVFEHFGTSYSNETDEESIAQKQLIKAKNGTIREIDKFMALDNNGRFSSKENQRKFHGNSVTIDPNCSLIFKFNREFFEENNNIVFCKELACVFVYGKENVPEFNPHPFYSGIDIEDFFKTASTNSGQTINITILDNSGSSTQSSYFVPILGKEVKINVVPDETMAESGVYVTHFKVMPSGTIVKSEGDVLFYTIEDALEKNLIFLTKEDAVTGGTREARWKHFLAKEEFERKKKADEDEWARKKEEMDRKQKALETEIERQRIVHEQKLEAERIKMERESKAHKEELERKAKEAEYERQKRDEEDKYDREKKKREDSNDKSSTFRKAFIDVLKIIPVALAAVTAVLVWMAKKAVMAAVI